MAFAIHLRYPGLPITYLKISSVASAISKKTGTAQVAGTSYPPLGTAESATPILMDGPRQIIKAEALNAIYAKKALLALMVK